MICRAGQNNIQETQVIPPPPQLTQPEEAVSAPLGAQQSPGVLGPEVTEGTEPLSPLGNFYQKVNNVYLIFFK